MADQLINGIDNEDLIKTGETIGEIAVIAVEDIPVAGKPVSYVLEKILAIAFAELEEEPTPIWDVIKNQVAAAIWTDKVETQRSFLQRKLTDIKASVKTLETYNTNAASYLPELISLENDVEADMTSFMPEEPAMAFYTLPFFIPLASIHLGLLFTKVNWAKQNSDGNEGRYKKNHLDLARKYGLYLRYMMPKAIEWRKSCIKIESEKYIPLTNVAPTIMERAAGLKTDLERFKGSYTDSEKPENSFELKDATNDAILVNTQNSFNQEIEKLMKTTVQPALDEWVRKGVVPQKVESGTLYPGQILWEESLTSGNYELQVKGDSVKLVDKTNSPTKVIWGRQYFGKSVFVGLTEQEFSIFSGNPYCDEVKEETIWSPTTTEEEIWSPDSPDTNSNIFATNLNLQENDGNLILFANRKLNSNGYGDFPVFMSNQAASVTGKVKLGIKNVRFKCSFSCESSFPVQDYAEVDRLSLFVKTQDKNTKGTWLVDWSGDPWDVKVGHIKDFSPSWTKVVDLSDPNSDLIFQAYTREHDKGFNPHDHINADEYKITMAQINDLVNVWGGKCWMDNVINLGDGRNDVNFEISFVLSMETVNAQSK